ncbi:uncharacterized protein BDR25DRAFT_303610 [Lindgomyces ingoldianus]|uniref:Uncharacterized protein n=1 Tax=Lindgomyces ingoldianus TaxID=673940 RepID=A0ACB6QYB5_9PLEO|nr:uncharacterized protein BDR25DRAFT_303610 [Lindgomyces ingoldianus]KAF2471082.1 hypothetical protein BDR25DRAFT_303610 [Lindgomyces ingoldianus]
MEHRSAPALAQESIGAPRTFPDGAIYTWVALAAGSCGLHTPDWSSFGHVFSLTQCYIVPTWRKAILPSASKRWNAAKLPVHSIPRTSPEFHCAAGNMAKVALGLQC